MEASVSGKSETLRVIWTVRRCESRKPKRDVESNKSIRRCKENRIFPRVASIRSRTDMETHRKRIIEETIVSAKRKRNAPLSDSGTEFSGGSY